MSWSVTLYGLVLPWVLVAVGCWLTYQIIRQNGRILLRLESLEAALRDPSLAGQLPTSIPIGSVAPEFDLPDFSGRRESLGQFRGRRVLLIFFSPQCGYCTKMLPSLATVASADKENLPLPVLITTGSAEQNQRLISAHGIRCPVLLQQKMEVASEYHATGTPTGYLIDEQGAIASTLAVGADALLALLDPVPTTETGRNGSQTPSPQHPRVHKGKFNRGLEYSRINRNGLRAGTAAPLFRLPLLNGEELALEGSRGRPLLLVFSDPQCGPCDQLAPELERFHRQQRDVQVLMVSRRDAEANRQKVKEQGLTFPVVLQEQWEISLRYGIFATPVGYLINEGGVLAADVAVGLESIRALMELAVLPARAETVSNGDSVDSATSFSERR
jgi:methylamine dehydrogenase accessory protein MauD